MKKKKTTKIGVRRKVRGRTKWGTVELLGNMVAVKSDDEKVQAHFFFTDPATRIELALDLLSTAGAETLVNNERARTLARMITAGADHTHARLVLSDAELQYQAQRAALEKNEVVTAREPFASQPEQDKALAAKGKLMKKAKTTKRKTTKRKKTTERRAR